MHMYCIPILTKLITVYEVPLVVYHGYSVSLQKNRVQNSTQTMPMCWAQLYMYITTITIFSQKYPPPLFDLQVLAEVVLSHL